MRTVRILCLILIVLAALSTPLFAAEEGHDVHVSPYLVIPFILMLGSIAVVPLKWEHWWEDNNNKLKIAAVLGIPVGLYFAFVEISLLEHSMLEYFAFIVYVGSLFVISGGILLKGDFKASAGVNLGFLATGAALASFIGTPGASMLLIRPVLRINQNRKSVKHVVIFFIFTVSNIGGCLTPLGDPPLFLGYLRGVPFTWTFNLWPQWLMANVILLILFYLIDKRLFVKEAVTESADKSVTPVPFGISGLVNFIWLAGVVLSVAFLDLGLRELVMVCMVLMSLKTTPQGLREENRFTYHPVIEVAYLFIGIFLTMIPALALLEANGPMLAEKGLTEPWMFFWFTGILSSFLDNAPTYLTFFALAQGMQMAGETVANTGITVDLLRAISLGAVFMGANTYIGNGPNFMVKAIADESGTKMPSFIGFMAWSGGILIPVFILITFIVFIF
jgi:Na+/H+ antiporter NhaD/arsenite permease-like protein